MGKLIGDSSSVDVPLSIECFRWYAEAIDKIYDEIAPNAISLIRREPLGVVGAVIPGYGETAGRRSAAIWTSMRSPSRA